ncbi:MAG: BrnT family toxin [Candidatus Promineifilaceae bacterium]
MSSRRPTTFEWDPDNERLNLEKHGVSFALAQYAFADPQRVILEDVTHSSEQANKRGAISALAKWARVS